MKSIGQMQTITLDVVKPIQFKETSIEWNKLTLMTGLNGTGKSVINKFNWIITTFLANLIASVKHKIPYNQNNGLQFLFTHTFDNHNTTGTIRAEYQFGNFIEIKLDEGKITNLVVSIEEDIDDAPGAIYMSTEMRLMSSIVKYLKFKKALGLSKGIPTSEPDFLKLLDSYKIYDIIFVEGLLQSIETRTSPAVLKELNETFSKFEKTGLQELVLTNLEVDYVNSDIIYSTATESKSVTVLGAGDQSLMTMFLGQVYQNH